MIFSTCQHFVYITLTATKSTLLLNLVLCWRIQSKNIVFGQNQKLESGPKKKKWKAFPQSRRENLAGSNQGSWFIQAVNMLVKKKLKMTSTSSLDHLS